MNATAHPVPMASSVAVARGRRDPLALILGPRESWDLISICLAIALFVHGSALGVAIVQNLLHDLHLAVDDNRGRLHDFFWRQYDIEVEKPKDEPKPEPPPPEPPPPEPAPAPKAVTPPKEDDPYKDAKPLPTPAQAAKILTAAPKDDDPVELPTIVSGEGTALGGVQSGEGKGDKITMNRNASPQGVPGGKGTVAAPPPPPPPTEDKSRPVGLPAGTGRNCPFPPEADGDQIDTAVAVVQITVRPDGSVLSAAVVSDPGHGFGRAARICALGWRVTPALNRAGEPVAQTVPVNVNFRR
jgi:periplasmic protein TonB